MKIITYNLNGIRAAIRKGWADWVLENDFDIVCVQETKALEEQVDLSVLTDAGYHAHWHSAEKKGYSGVLTLSKSAPDHVVEGCGIKKYDEEGRVLRTDFGDWTLLNCYFPSGTSGDVRQDFKMDFLSDIFDFVTELKKDRSKIILVGDYNIAHTEKDIHNPVSNKNSSGFKPEERAWMTEWFDSGFVDAFRQIHTDKIEYSWWTYRANARANNKGWRIDYQSVTENMKDLIKDAHHLGDAVHSDHCPVYMEIDLTF